jgi:acylphosphatase
MNARRFVITGHVQGVFFREWTVSRAREIGVTGWVRNRRDGGVEVYAVGEQAQLDRFTEKLREGSPASRIGNIEVQEAPAERCEGFVRRQTV